MKKIMNLEELKKDKLKPCVVALGTFDGVHLGHLDVITTAKEYAKENHLDVCVFTFSNHPLSEILPEKVPPILMSNEEKDAFFDHSGIDVLVSIPFTEKFSKISPSDFLKLLSELNTKAIVVGENYSYGFLGEGNIRTLEEDAPKLNMKVLGRNLIKIDDVVVSSTNIRRLIHDGNIVLANKMLGRPYYIEGTVVHGEERGRQINFPTANLDLKKGLFAIPKFGVYAGKVVFSGKSYKALVNIGQNPTFGEDILRLEAHILGFEGDLYGKEIKVQLFNFIRPEKKFSSLEELKEQIIKDQKEIEKYLENT